MSPKLGLSLAGLSLALTVAAQETTTHTHTGHDLGCLGGPLGILTQAVNATSPSATAMPQSEFGSKIFELTTSGDLPVTPVGGQTQETANPVWNNATDPIIFSINPITPTGPPRTTFTGTPSPIYNSLLPGMDLNATEMAGPTASQGFVTVQVQGLNATKAYQGTGTPIPLPTHKSDDFDDGHHDSVVESEAGKASAVSVAGIVAVLAMLTAFGI